MEKLLVKIISSKGFLIGLLTGILLVLKAIRDGNFKWSVAIPNLLGAMIMGYIAYSVGEERLSEYLNILWTAFMSLNSFLVIDVTSDPEFVKRLIKNKIGYEDKKD